MTGSLVRWVDSSEPGSTKKKDNSNPTLEAKFEFVVNRNRNRSRARNRAQIHS